MSLHPVEIVPHTPAVAEIQPRKTTVRIGVAGASMRAKALLAEAVKAAKKQSVELRLVYVHDRVPAVVDGFLSGVAALGIAVEPDAARAEHTPAHIVAAKLDLMMVTSINCFHADDVIAALDGGVQNVFCEKPLCTTYDQARQLLVATMRANVPISSGFVLRHAPIWKAARKAIRGDGPASAEVLNITFNEVLTKSHGVLARAGWRGVAELSGGHIVEKLVHDLDLMMWFAGGVPLRITAASDLVYWTREREHLHAAAIARQEEPNLFRMYNGGDPELNNPFPSQRWTAEACGVKRAVGEDAAVSAPKRLLDDTFSIALTVTGDHGPSGENLRAGNRMLTLTSNTYGTSGTRTVSASRGDHATIEVAAPNYDNPTITTETRGYVRGGPNDQAIRSTTTLPNAGGCHGGGDEYMVAELLARVINGDYRSREERVMQTLEFAQSTLVAIAAEQAARDKAAVNLIPLWKNFGIPHRHEDYGTPVIPCWSDLHVLSVPPNQPLDPRWLQRGATWSKPDAAPGTPLAENLPVTAAFVVLVDTDARVYLIDHGVRGIDLAGGRLKKSPEGREPPAVGAARELLEETGLQIDAAQLRLAGVKLMLATHAVPTEFPFPANAVNLFFTQLIKPLTAEQLGSLRAAKGDVSRGLVCMTLDDAISHECYRVHMPVFSAIRDHFGL